MRIRVLGSCLLAALSMTTPFAWGQENSACGSATPINGAGSASILIRNTPPLTTQDGPLCSCRPVSAIDPPNLVNNNRDVWYSYTAYNDGVVDIRATGCPWSNGASLTIFSTCVTTSTPTSAELACFQNICTTTASFEVAAGSTYILRVATYSQGSTASSQGSSTAATLTITEQVNNSNDNCANARPMLGKSVSSLYIGPETTSDGPDASCKLSETDNSLDVWYAYTASVSGSATVTGYAPYGCYWFSGASLTVFPSCGSTTELHCFQQICDNTANFNITAGTTYILRIATYNQHVGYSPHILRIGEEEVIPAPPNDTCAQAQLIAAGAWTLDNRAANNSGTTAPSCAAGDVGTHDVWYTYTASVNGEATFSINSNNYLFAAYNTTCGGAEVGCGAGNAMVLNTVASHSYIIRVAVGAAGEPGRRTLTVSEIARPVNDTCQTATNVNGEGTHTWNDAIANDDAPFPPCGIGSNPNQRDVWYRYTASSSGSVIVTCRQTSDGSFDINEAMNITVFSDSCTSPQVVACAQPGTTASSSYACFQITAGQTYLLRFGRINGGSMWSMTIDEFEPYAGGETCFSPLDIADGSYNIINARYCDDANDFPPTCTSRTSRVNIWLQYTPVSSGVAVFDTLIDGMLDGFATDTIITAYSSCHVVLDCNDDLSFSNNYRASYLAVPVTAGQPILVRIGLGYSPLYNNLIGIEYPLNIALVSNLPNDECAGAIAITPGTTAFDNRNATNSSQPFPCVSDVEQYVPEHDLWYKWTATGSGQVSVHNCNPLGTSQIPASYTMLAVYDNSCSGTAVACNDNGYNAPVQPCSDESARLTFNAVAGHTYYIRVAGQIKNFGNGLLTLTVTCPADFNNDGARDVADLFAYINAWLAKTANADFNNSGSVDVADLFAYINAWLAGC